MILAVMKAIVRAIEQGRRGVVATVVSHQGSSPGKQDQKMLYLDDGTTVGSVGGGGLEALVLQRCATVLQQGKGTVLSLAATEHGDEALGMLCGGTAEVALELLPAVPRVLICGGGHCGLEVARLCAQLAYPHEVHEDRPDLVDEHRFPHASRRHVGHPERLSETVGDLGRFSHVLVASRGHELDREYVRALAKAGYQGWVGMLGSQRKSATLRRLLQQEDQLDAGFVQAIESPVGLPIGAVTPAEIAVSIMARIVETARGATS